MIKTKEQMEKYCLKCMTYNDGGFDVFICHTCDGEKFIPSCLKCNNKKDYNAPICTNCVKRSNWAELPEKYFTYRHTYSDAGNMKKQCCKFKEFDSLDDAIKYAKRYAKGEKFAGVQIDDQYRTVYEINAKMEIIKHQ